MKRYRPAAKTCITFCLLSGLAGCAGFGGDDKSEPAPPPPAPATVPADQADIPSRSLAQALQLVRDNQLDAAEQALTRLTRKQPDLAEAWLNLGLLNARSNRLDEAEEALNQAARLAPRSPLVLNELGIVRRKQGRHAAAEQAYKRALALDADYAPAHRNLGILYDLHLGRSDQALTHYRRYAELKPDDEVVELWIAQLEQPDS